MPRARELGGLAVILQEEGRQPKVAAFVRVLEECQLLAPAELGRPSDGEVGGAVADMHLHTTIT